MYLHKIYNSEFRANKKRIPMHFVFNKKRFMSHIGLFLSKKKKKINEIWYV